MNQETQKEQQKEVQKVEQVKWAKNTHMNQYPPRPILTYEIVLQCAKELCERYKYSDLRKKNSPHDVASCFSISGILPNDGFQLAIRLKEQYGWRILNQDLEILEHLNYHAQMSLRGLEKEWFEKNNITPPYEEGTQTDQGEILSIEEDCVAYYYVMDYSDPEKITSGKVKFEDVSTIWR